MMKGGTNMTTNTMMINTTTAGAKTPASVVVEFPRAQRMMDIIAKMPVFDRVALLSDEAELIMVAAEMAVEVAETDGPITLDTIRDRDMDAAIRCAYMSVIDNGSDAIRAKRPKFKLSSDTTRKMDPAAVGAILARTGAFKALVSADGDTRRVIMRQDNGDAVGTYAVQYAGNAPEMLAVVQCLVPTADMTYCNKVLSYMSSLLDKVSETRNPDHVYLMDGVLDLADKQVPKAYPFTPYTIGGKVNPEFVEKYGEEIRLKKLAVRWNPNAVNPTITMPDGKTWDIEQQIRETFTDERGQVINAAVEAWWTFMAMVCRGINGRKTVLLQNARGMAGGQNGKSTLLDLVRSIVGTRNVLSVKMESIGERFSLAGLDRKLAVVADESDGAIEKIAKAADLKLLISGEPVPIEGKGKDIYYYAYGGPIAFAINGYLRSAAKDDAYYERFLVIPFDHEFAVGGRRKYIKDDYIKRQNVLEYVVYKALTQYGDKDEYDVGVIAGLEQYKAEMRENSSNVYKMMADVEPMLEAWASNNGTGYVVPDWALYEIFRDRQNGWCQQNGVGSALQLANFRQELTLWCNSTQHWERVDTDKVTSVTGKVDAAVLLLRQYPVASLVNKRTEYITEQPYSELGCWLTNDCKTKRSRGGIKWLG